MMSSSPQPFGINIDFLAEMVVFGSSENISPLEFDPRTGLPKPFPPLIRDITAEAYFVRGEDLYIYRQAEDCGPGEERYEEVLVGKVRDVATGTYAYYGRIVRSGSVGTGGGGTDGSGGGGDSGYTPGPAPGAPPGSPGMNADGSIQGTDVPSGQTGFGWA